MGWFSELFARTTTVEYVDEQGFTHRKRLNRKTFDRFVGDTLAEGKAKSLRACIAHIIDPLCGYRTENWIVGEHVSEEMFGRFGQGNDLYVMTFYENGLPQTSVVEPSIWRSLHSQIR